MKRLEEIFDIRYGSQLDLNKCVTCEKPEGYNFVNRGEKNCGVSARILEEENKKPFPAGLISVAMGGNVLSSFVQQEPFYTGQNVKVLTPLREMSDLIKLYYCYCIEQNIFRFSTMGREANVSFESIIVPDIEEIPEELNKISISDYEFKKEPIIDEIIELNTENWKKFGLNDLFRIYTSNEENAMNRQGGATPFISSTKFNNGVSKYVEDAPTQSINTITVARNGSVGYAFYQPIPYCASPDDIRIFAPKFQLNKYIAFFLLPIIEKEKFRYEYGRKFGTKRMSTTKIKLPATKDDTPNWQFMEDYVKSLPYSDKI
ncbi:MAG: restriction endonuclease subunit S [Prevotellaceae bacterium]|jgi:hypothetical protein|nr:restriction endonuclease subunit S [Prevotellaceae bacterium]